MIDENNAKLEKSDNQDFEADSHHSELEHNPELLEKYIKTLEEEIGHNSRVVGVLEIGSYANGEGVPGFSDVDTRVYVESDDMYIFNFAGHKKSEEVFEENGEVKDFLAEYGKKPIENFTWTDFNIPMWDELEKDLDIPIEFGLSDKRFANFELENIENSPTNEHSFLMKRKIIYDPNNFLSNWKKRLEGKKYSKMVNFYSDQYLNGLSQKLYNGLEITHDDLEDIRSRKKIQWVKRAVRHIREAITTKVYSESGEIVHKKEDILKFYKKHLPEEYDFVSRLYYWKTDYEKRQKIIKGCLQNPKKYSQKFEEMTGRLERVISEVKELDLS